MIPKLNKHASIIGALKTDLKFSFLQITYRNYPSGSLYWQLWMTCYRQAKVDRLARKTPFGRKVAAGPF